jgi:hypothetical protein
MYPQGITMHILSLLLIAFATIALFMPPFMIFAVWLLKKEPDWCLRDVADASTGSLYRGYAPFAGRVPSQALGAVVEDTFF